MCVCVCVCVCVSACVSVVRLCARDVAICIKEELCTAKTHFEIVDHMLLAV